MNLDPYIERIGYHGPLQADINCLKQLHKHHLMSIPFEALDPYLGRAFDLRLESIYEKVVVRERGGYCYELNHLFHELLTQIGFDNHLISAQVFDDNKYGPPHDHMAILINLEEPWLVDVAFGDLFIEPIHIRPNIQQEDYFKFYKVERISDSELILNESLKTKIDYQVSYKFSTTPRKIADFEEQNKFKQSSPDSHFVKNRICTMATNSGRKTIRNSTFKVRTGAESVQKEISGDEELDTLLKTVFGIHL